MIKLKDNKSNKKNQQILIDMKDKYNYPLLLKKKQNDSVLNLCIKMY